MCKSLGKLIHKRTNDEDIRSNTTKPSKRRRVVWQKKRVRFADKTCGKLIEYFSYEQPSNSCEEEEHIWYQKKDYDLMTRNTLKILKEAKKVAVTYDKEERSSSSLATKNNYKEIMAKIAVVNRMMPNNINSISPKHSSTTDSDTESCCIRGLEKFVLEKSLSVNKRRQLHSGLVLLEQKKQKKIGHTDPLLLRKRSELLSRESYCLAISLACTDAVDRQL